MPTRYNVSLQVKRTLRFTKRQANEVKNQLLGRYPDRFGLFDVYSAFNADKNDHPRGEILYRDPNILFSNEQEKVLIYSLTQRGFFSEVNNMINAAMYCVNHDTGFVLDSKDFLYREKLGWEDYFVRFWQNVDEDKRCRRFFLNYRSDLRLWNRIRNYDFRKVNVPALGLRENCVFANKRRFTRNIYRYQPGFAREIRTGMRKLGLPNVYAACHIRRGDKVGECKGVAESERIEAPAYLDRLLEADPEMRALFICSDSYKAVEEIESYIRGKGLDIRVITTCKPEDQGHSTEILKEQFDDKFESVLRLLIDVEASAGSSCFAGTYSSNLSRFVPLLHGDPERCFSLDDPWHVG